MQQTLEHGQINSRTISIDQDVPTSFTTSDRSISLHISKGKNKFPIPIEYDVKMFKHPTPHPVRQLDYLQAHNIVSLPLNISSYE